MRKTMGKRDLVKNERTKGPKLRTDQRIVKQGREIEGI